MKESFYDILNVTPDASVEEISMNYKELIKPLFVLDEHQSYDIAYETLSNPSKRATYDKLLKSDMYNLYDRSSNTKKEAPITKEEILSFKDKFQKDYFDILSKDNLNQSDDSYVLFKEDLLKSEKILKRVIKCASIGKISKTEYESMQPIIIDLMKKTSTYTMLIWNQVMLQIFENINLDKKMEIDNNKSISEIYFKSLEELASINYEDTKKYSELEKEFFNDYTISNDWNYNDKRALNKLKKLLEKYPNSYRYESIYDYCDAIMNSKLVELKRTGETTQDEKYEAEYDDLKDEVIDTKEKFDYYYSPEIYKDKDGNPIKKPDKIEIKNLKTNPILAEKIAHDKKKYKFAITKSLICTSVIGVSSATTISSLILLANREPINIPLFVMSLIIWLTYKYKKEVAKDEIENYCKLLGIFQPIDDNENTITHKIK